MKGVFRNAIGAPLASAEQLATGKAGGLALDGTHVYWSAGGISNGDPGLFSIAKTGGQVTTISGSVSTMGLAVDGTSIYFSGLATGSDQGIFKVAKP